MGIALGSAAELETQLIIAKELGLGQKNELKNAEILIVEILKILSVIIKKLRVPAS
ncbi:MAG: four helix bundle protein [Patescibacteria group bacterium]